MKKVAIICGGPSSEYEVSLNSARSIYENIDKHRYDVYIFHINKKGLAVLKKCGVDEILKEKKSKPFLEMLKDLSNFDMCFLATHGEFGEDGVLQTFLEYFNIKYTGSDAYSSRLGMDKYRTSIIVKEKIKGLIVPEMHLIKVRDLEGNFMKYPFVLKPNKKGSSVGVYIVRNDKDKKSAVKNIKKEYFPNEEFLTQEAILDSIEVSCGCLEDNREKFLDIPPIEIIPQLDTFFDYNSKYTKGGSVEVTPPALISKNISKRITELSKEIHRVCGCSVYSRSDFLVKNGKIYFLEINTLPGMTSTSLLPQECKAMGMSFTELIGFIIQNSKK